MASGNSGVAFTQADTLRWALEAVRAKKVQANQVLTQLNQQEQYISRQLQSAASGTANVTSTQSTTPRGPGRPKKTGTTSTGRKSHFSPETRKRMSEAQKRRHLNKTQGAANTGETVTTSASAPEIPQPDLALPTM